MQKIRLLKELEKYPVFDVNRMKGIINKNAGYTRLVLHRLKSEGFAIEVERNKYTVHDDPMLVGSSIIWPCYISCWTALRHYNLTEQLPQNIFVITTRTRKKNKLNFLNNEIMFAKVRTRHFFGYKRENYHNFSIFLAEPEKAVIDCALLKRASFSELYDIIKEHKQEFDFKLFASYIVKIGNVALIKRFGFLFEKLDIDTGYDLKKLVDRKYSLLDYAGEASGDRNKTWMLIENVKLG